MRFLDYEAIMKIRHPNLVRDALYHTHARSGASEDRAQGVVLSVVCMLMAMGMQFFEALHYMEDHLPMGYRLHAIPEPWREGLTRREEAT